MYRAFISINGRRINYKCIIATNSFMCAITIASYTIWKKTALCYTYMVVNKVHIDGESYCLRLKEPNLLKSKHQTQRPILYSNQHPPRLKLTLPW